MIRINGARLRQWRDEANFTQEDFAAILHCDERTIRNAETTGKMSSRMIDAVCRKLQKPRAELESLSSDLQVALLDGVDEKQEDLYQSALQCHQRLFPDSFAELSREHMRKWLMESYLHKQSGTPWREIYAVAYEENSSQREVVALTSLSAHTEWEFWYCTRFGVLPERRSGLKVEMLLLDAVMVRANTLYPKATMCIWEVEAPNLVLLGELRNHLGRGGTLRAWPHQKPMIEALRTARRLALFSAIHARVAVTPSGKPLTITSPAWREPLNSSNEREMMLMIHPLGGNLARPHPTVSKTLDFLYKILYGDSFGGGTTSVELKNYRIYVERLLERVKKGAAK